MKSKHDRNEPEIVGFVGVGLDNRDGEHRLTKSEHFFIVGGSRETHERMQDTAIRFGEKLKKRGKVLRETPPAEVIEILRDASE